MDVFLEHSDQESTPHEGQVGLTQCFCSNTRDLWCRDDAGDTCETGHFGHEVLFSIFQSMKCCSCIRAKRLESVVVPRASEIFQGVHIVLASCSRSQSQFTGPSSATYLHHAHGSEYDVHREGRCQDHLCPKALHHVNLQTNFAHVVQTTRAVHRDSDPLTLKGVASSNETDTGDNCNLSHRWERSADRRNASGRQVERKRQAGILPVGPWFDSRSDHLLVDNHFCVTFISQLLALKPSTDSISTRRHRNSKPAMAAGRCL